MKKWIQSIGIVALALISYTVQAQMATNEYGAPKFTGGTVASPNESFAIYHHNLQSSVKEVYSPGIREVYPNPATISTRIVLESVPARPTTLSVFNTSGVLVGSYQFTPGTSWFDLDVSYLPQGIYSLQIQEDGKEAQSVQLSKY